MSRRSILLAAAVAAGLSLTACDAVSNATEAAKEVTAPAQAAPLTPSGSPQTLTAEAEGDENLQYAASVVRLDPIPDTDAKLFGTAGGDPAINGLYTYLAVFRSSADGWAIYQIGDFNDYTVLSTGPNRVDLEINKSTWNDAEGKADTVVSKVIVQWTPGEDGAPPTSVTVTPAS